MWSLNTQCMTCRDIYSILHVLEVYANLKFVVIRSVLKDNEKHQIPSIKAHNICLMLLPLLFKLVGSNLLIKRITSTVCLQ